MRRAIFVGSQDDGGNGARGDGGLGGHGGGVVCVGTAKITIPQTMLVAGTGGTSFGNAGARGVATNTIGCQFF